jgi:hypothetical protein
VTVGGTNEPLLGVVRLGGQNGRAKFSITRPPQSTPLSSGSGLVGWFAAQTGYVRSARCPQVGGKASGAAELLDRGFFFPKLLQYRPVRGGSLTPLRGADSGVPGCEVGAAGHSLGLSAEGSVRDSGLSVLATHPAGAFVRYGAALSGGGDPLTPDMGGDRDRGGSGGSTPRDVNTPLDAIQHLAILRETAGSEEGVQLSFRPLRGVGGAFRTLPRFESLGAARARTLRRPTKLSHHVVGGFRGSFQQQVSRALAQQADFDFRSLMGQFRQPQVRYRPGLSTHWRAYREQFRIQFRMGWGLQQKRLTAYVTRLRRVASFSYFRLLLASVGHITHAARILTPWGALHTTFSSVRGG